MTQKILLKKNATAGLAPTAASLELGEVAINTADGVAFIKNGANTVLRARFTSYDGWGTARTLTIGSTGKSVNGSGNVSWSLAEIGAAASSHTHTLSQITDSGNLAAINTNGSTANYLRGDGTWVTPPNTTYSAGTGLSLSGTTFTNTAPHIGTNLGSSGTGATRTITSSTGSNTSITYTAADVGAPPTSRTITAGNGLSGGGDLSANRTLSVDASVVRTSGNQTIGGVKTFTNQLVVDGGVGVASSGTFHVRQRGDTVNDGIALTSSNAVATRVWKDSSGAFHIGTAGNPEQLSVALNGVISGNGSGLTNLNGSNITTGTVADARIASTLVRTSRTITAGDGLSGGGDLSANRTLSVDASVVRTSGNQTIGGVKTFTSDVNATNFVLTSDARLKTERRRIEFNEDSLDLLQGEVYKKGDVIEAGTIAQDWRKVLPESVYEGEDGMLSVSTSAHVAYLVEALKYNKRKRIELEERLAKLEKLVGGLL